MLESLANLVIGQEDDCEGDEETQGVDVGHVGQLKLTWSEFILNLIPFAEQPIENRLV